MSLAMDYKGAFNSAVSYSYGFALLVVAWVLMAHGCVAFGYGSARAGDESTSFYQENALERRDYGDYSSIPDKSRAAPPPRRT